MNGNENNNQSAEVAADAQEKLPVEVTAPASAPAAPEGDRVWDSLNFLNRELKAFNLIPAMLVPHCRDRDVVAKVENPRETLLAPMQLLVNDVDAFRTRLEAIAAKHADRTGSSNSADEQMEAIQINEEYIQWGAEYETVVTPNVMGMMSALLEAGAAVNTAQLSAKPTDVIEASMAEEEVVHD